MSDGVFRMDYWSCLKALRERLREPAPGRLQILSGPRQVGKTTLLLELAARLGPSARYASMDEPRAVVPGFWDRLWEAAEALASARRAFLLLDEIQHLHDWAAALKSRWDRVLRLKLPLHVVASGSSALRLSWGSRESLAGRFERLTLAHWPAGALKAAFRISPTKAAHSLVEWGSYPGTVKLAKDPARWRAYVHDAIIEPAIGRDVLSMGSVRRPALLRQVFALAATLPSQVVTLQKLQGQLTGRGALETIAHYLALLEEGYLVASLEKYSVRPHRLRTSPPKLLVLNNALITALHPDGPPDAERDPARFGVWVENACLAHAWNAGQRVLYWREGPIDVDAVLEGSWGEWAVEVKTGRYGSQDLKGLFEFCRRYPRFRPLVITSRDNEKVARELGAASVSWEDFLLEGPRG